MTQPDPDAQFDVVQLVDLDDWLRQKFTWQKSGDEWIYGGSCPRCGHEVDKLFKPQALYAFQQGRTEPEARTMRCNCPADHAGRESGDGCGAWWGLGLAPRGTAT